MKFVKVVIDGKEYYKRVDGDAESICENGEYESEEQANGSESSRGEKFAKDAANFFSKLGCGSKELGIKAVACAKAVSGKIKTEAERIFAKDKPISDDCAEMKLVRMLPYMSKPEVHEVADKLLSNDGFMKKFDINSVMPFLEVRDCEAMLKRSIALGNSEFDISDAMKYVSDECITKIVDGYIDGKYPGLDIDALYPYVKEDDIKRLFYIILENEKTRKKE